MPAKPDLLLLRCQFRLIRISPKLSRLVRLIAGFSFVSDTLLRLIFVLTGGGVTTGGVGGCGSRFVGNIYAEMLCQRFKSTVEPLRNEAEFPVIITTVKFPPELRLLPDGTAQFDTAANQAGSPLLHVDGKITKTGHRLPTVTGHGERNFLDIRFQPVERDSKG